MPRGIGIDAVEIERIERALTRHGDAFRQRILSSAEIGLLDSSPRPAELLAGRFAAKEAVMKVLGGGPWRGIRFRDIEVLRDSTGVPVVHLDGEAARRARTLGVRRVFVTITHAGGMAIAAAVGE